MQRLHKVKCKNWRHRCPNGRLSYFLGALQHASWKWGWVYSPTGHQRPGEACIDHCGPILIQFIIATGSQTALENLSTVHVGTGKVPPITEVWAIWICPKVHIDPPNRLSKTEDLTQLPGKDESRFSFRPHANFGHNPQKNHQPSPTLCLSGGCWDYNSHLPQLEWLSSHHLEGTNLEKASQSHLILSSLVGDFRFWLFGERRR